MSFKSASQLTIFCTDDDNDSVQNFEQEVEKICVKLKKGTSLPFTIVRKRNDFVLTWLNLSPKMQMNLSNCIERVKIKFENELEEH